jgi:signal transduction histidine kinase
LNDGAIQSLYAVELKLDSYLSQIEAESSEANEEIESVIEDLNLVIRNLRSHLFDLLLEQREGQNLRDSLEDLLREVSVNTLIATELIVAQDNDPTANLTIEQRRLSFLIARETMANIEKHSQARNVQMEISDKDGKFKMRIAHDGGSDGDWEAVSEKARWLASQLRIDSGYGSGTSITSEFALPTWTQVPSHSALVNQF